MEEMVIGPRQLLFTIIFTFAALSVSFANNVYVAQTAQGSGSGADCADALSVTYFNSGSNWTSSAPTGTQIGPGTTVYLCGTISTNLTFQGNGASGSPVVLDGSNATMNAYINAGRTYWTIQNATWSTSYATNSGNQAVIQIPHGGATFGTIQNNHIDVLNSAQAIFIGYGSHDIMVQNNYLKVSTSSAGDGFDTDVLDTEGSYNVTIQGNYFETAIGSGDNPCTSCHDDIIQTWAASGSTANYPYNWTIRDNYFKENSPGKNAYQEMILFQNTGVGYWDFYSNVLECTAGANGGNGIVSYGNATGAVLNFYNNTIVEDVGACNNLFNLQSTGTYNLTNNIIYASDNITMLYNPSGTVNRSKNLWYGSTQMPSCSGTTDICNQNPLFTNFAGSDFSLQTGSPALGVGVNLGTSYNQYPMPGTTWPNPTLGTRPSNGAWDLGAYDPSGPAPPAGLTAVVK